MSQAVSTAAVRRARKKSSEQELAHVFAVFVAGTPALLLLWSGTAPPASHFEAVELIFSLLSFPIHARELVAGEVSFVQRRSIYSKTETKVKHKSHRKRERVRSKEEV